MMRKSEIEKWVIFIGFYVLWIAKGKDTNIKVDCEMRYVYGKWDLLPVDGMMWLWWVSEDVGGERGPPFILKGEVFLLVWTPTEAFMLVGVWTMSSDWSGYEGWTMFPDWSELNHALWLVRTWWLKIYELNHELWLVRTWWLKIYELNHVLWLVRTWGLKNVSWTLSCDWSELEDWKYVRWTMSCD